ncbi:1-acyl-sn-glycerol-3-phosphate acyltransferase epsilon [Plakobranchus ocellatus]|uniref:1-acyl-sn-glycerol-3-phosphate acyltransferase epsilon n=1 Tax=Plakobranchus ocellatus TaxID=259542 RepID=A0AAV4BHK1_9GAST|nr:1-acyl-sn-glycerol-3-phosphate acyltransferase epsilon [Plakobranchus ocellatus]
MLTGIVLLENLRWVLPTTFMIGAAPAYITIWAAWRAVSAVLPRSVYVKGDDFLFSTYHRNLLFFFETLTGVELIFYGDLNAIQETSENSLYMSNHQSTMDWVIASCIALRRGCLGRTRYVLKDGLRFLPFYGFYLGVHGSVFVKRAGKFNKKDAEKQLSKDAKDEIPTWLVIFPEGTRFNPELPSVIQESKQFAVGQGLEPFEHVLFPRSRALETCIQQLRPNLHSIYDVTIAYSNTFDPSNRQRVGAPTMQDFLLGKCPKVHIHISRVLIDSVPSESSELKQWLHQRFQAKDSGRLPQRCITANTEARNVNDRHFHRFNRRYRSSHKSKSTHTHIYDHKHTTSSIPRATSTTKSNKAGKTNSSTLPMFKQTITVKSILKQPVTEPLSQHEEELATHITRKKLYTSNETVKIRFKTRGQPLTFHRVSVYRKSSNVASSPTHRGLEHLTITGKIEGKHMSKGSNNNFISLTENRYEWRNMIPNVCSRQGASSKEEPVALVPDLNKFVMDLHEKYDGEAKLT